MALRTVLLVAAAVVVSILAGLGIGYQVGRRDNSDYLNSVRIAALNDRLTALQVMREYKVPRDVVESLEISAVLYLDSIAVDAPGSNSTFLLQETARRLGAYAKAFPDSALTDPKHLKIAQVRNLAPK